MIDINEIDMPGGSRTEHLDGYSDKIESNKIITFFYNHPKFHVEARLDNDKIRIIASGGYSVSRDGSYFRLDYFIDDLSFMNKLQDIIVKYDISKNNGYFHETSGLPAGIGDYISVEYDSGEKIYKSSNQALNLSNDSITAIYELFHKNALENGFDFNSKGSNVELYDDANNDYLQGKWEGTHFGDKIIVEFNDDNIKIYINDKLVDDTKYIIYEGNIKKNKLKDGIDKVKDKYSYEEFSEISSFAKKNDILLTAYFTKDSYSTCDLLRQQKQ